MIIQEERRLAASQSQKKRKTERERMQKDCRTIFYYLSKYCTELVCHFARGCHGINNLALEPESKHCRQRVSLNSSGTICQCYLPNKFVVFVLSDVFDLFSKRDRHAECDIFQTLAEKLFLWPIFQNFRINEK